MFPADGEQKTEAYRHFALNMMNGNAEHVFPEDAVWKAAGHHSRQPVAKTALTHCVARLARKSS
ncbi:MAG: hypothetical protein OXD29_14295 [Roseovarius sp.]|nr:hypothetical protein [Roseovarius sp.]